MREIFWHQIYPFQAFLSNFGFGGRKAPPQWGNFFDIRSIHFRQFWATLVLVAEKPLSPEEENFFDLRSIHFRQFWATLVLVAEKPPPMREIILTPDLSISGNFEQLCFWWQKSPLPPKGTVYVRGLLCDMKDHLSGTVTVSFQFFSNVQPSNVNGFLGFPGDLEGILVNYIEIRYCR